MSEANIAQTAKSLKGYRRLFFAVLLPHQAKEIRPLEVIAVFGTKTGVHELLGKYFDFERVVAPFKAAAERQIKDFRVIVPENDVLRINVFQVLLLLLAILDVAMKRTILGNRMPPELATAARFLANFELDAFFLLVFW